MTTRGTIIKTAPTPGCPVTVGFAEAFRPVVYSNGVLKRTNIGGSMPLIMNILIESIYETVTFPERWNLVLQ